MADKTRINDFIQRWRMIIPDDRLFTELRSRVSKVISSFRAEIEKIDQYSLLYDLEYKFADFNGTTYQQAERYSKGNNILSNIDGSPGFLDLILTLQRLFWSIENIVPAFGKESAWKTANNNLIAGLNIAIDRSAGINLRKLQISNGTIDLYPEGVPFLDEMVDKNAVWLKIYPDIAKEYHNALSIVASKDINSYRQALDSLRFALEKLLKIVLKNNAPIEKQKDDLVKWMKQKHVHAQIRNNYTLLLNQYSLYQNTAVKHDHEPDPDEILVYSSSEVEYIIYLTSTMMRFMLEVNETQQ